MDIVLLAGKSNSGKSSTMRRLLDDLTTNPSYKGFKFLKVGQKTYWNIDVSAAKSVVQSILLKKQDFICVFELNGVIIGINSYGDKMYWISRGMDIFISYDCDWAVLACREKGPAGCKNVQSRFGLSAKSLAVIHKAAQIAGPNQIKDEIDKAAEIKQRLAI